MLERTVCSKSEAGYKSGGARLSQRSSSPEQSILPEIKCLFFHGEATPGAGMGTLGLIRVPVVSSKLDRSASWEVFWVSYSGSWRGILVIIWHPHRTGVCMLSWKGPE